MTDENIVQTQPWHSMYIGVSSILLGSDEHQVETETKDINVANEHNTINKNEDETNQSDSTSSTNNATSPSIPSTATTNPSPPSDPNHNTQDKDVHLQLENKDLRSQVLQYQNNQTKTTKQRRMSTLDHEVLHSALTCEIQSLTKQLEQEKTIKTKLQETFNTVSIDHQSQTEHIAHLLELVKSSENEKQHLKREIDLMEETIIDYENQIEEMVQDKKTDVGNTACCGCLSTSGSKGNTNKGRSKHKRNSAKPKRRKSKQGFDGFDNEME